MSRIKKGVACRVCKNNVDGVCQMGHTEPAHRADDCWYYQNRMQNSGLAIHSDPKPE